MSPLRLVLIATTLGVAEPAFAVENPVADVVTMRDGAVVVGDVTNAPGGGLQLVARRAWIREHAPDWARRWESAEKVATPRALQQRRERLLAWRRDRNVAPVLSAESDRITPWIDAELAASSAPRAEAAPLLRLLLLRADVSRIARKAPECDGFLRQAWLSGFREPESLSIEQLRSALEDRGFDISRPLSASVESLIAIRPEPEDTWLTRRAATEVSFDPNLRLLEYQGILLPDPSGANSQAAAPLPALQALPALSGLLNPSVENPLPVRLRSVATWGRVGCLVTRLEMAPDFSAATVEARLYVRQGSTNWRVSGTRSARVRLDDLGPDAGRELANDPQVAAAMRLVEGIGLKELTPEIRRRGLGMGAATQRALGQTRAAVEADLAALAFPVLATPRPGEARRNEPTRDANSR